VGLVKVADFPSRLEAETVGHALDQEEIPFLVQSDDVGIFGPGMVGTTPAGASLWVWEEHLERVNELLSCVTELPFAPEDEDGSDPGTS